MASRLYKESLRPTSLSTRVGVLLIDWPEPEMETAMLGGVGSGRGSRAPTSVCQLQRSALSLGLGQGDYTLFLMAGICMGRGTRRLQRELWPGQWMSPGVSHSRAVTSAGLVTQAAVYLALVPPSLCKGQGTSASTPRPPLGHPGYATRTATPLPEQAARREGPALNTQPPQALR